MAYGRLIVRQLHTMMDTQLQLIRDKAYVNGAWVGAASGKTFNVLNPANGKVVGCVPDMNAADTLKAIEAAWESFQTWQLTTPKMLIKCLFDAHHHSRRESYNPV